MGSVLRGLVRELKRAQSKLQGVGGGDTVQPSGRGKWLGCEACTGICEIGLTLSWVRLVWS